MFCNLNSISFQAFKKSTRQLEFIFRHARPTRQVFSVSIDINYSEQKFAKETF